MNRAQRRQLKRLPTSLDAWEVGLRDIGLSVADTELEGVMIVAERRSGIVRAAGPVVAGGDLWDVLGRAFIDPPEPCTHARPREVLCADPALVRRLKTALHGLGVVVRLVGGTPASDEALEALAEQFAPIEPPGTPEDRPLWASALERFAQQAPWRLVSDSVVFTFERVPGMERMCAVVLGRGGEQIGLSLYPSRLDLDRFLAAALARRVEDLAGVEVWSLFLDPIAEVEPPELEASRAAGLVTSDGLVPRLLAMRGTSPGPVGPSTQQCLLAALEAVTALVAEQGPRVEIAPTSCAVSTRKGAMVVRSSPPAFGRVDRPLFSEFVAVEALVKGDFRVGMGDVTNLDTGESTRTFVIKQRKREALRLAKALEGVDAVRVVRTGPVTMLHAVAQSVDLGPLVDLMEPGLPEQFESIGELLLVVSGGGASRVTIKPEQFVFETMVKVET